MGKEKYAGYYIVILHHASYFIWEGNLRPIIEFFWKKDKSAKQAVEFK